MSGPSALRSTVFRREREATWARLARLVERVEQRGLASLDARELAELPTVYRATMSSLSVARAISLDRNLLDYLEGLAQRAWCAFYTPARPWRQRLAAFATSGFPRGVRALALPLLLAVATLALGVAVGFALTRADPEAYYALVPTAYAQGRHPGTSPRQLEEALYSGPSDGGELAWFASRLVTNNAGVGLMMVAVGFLAGLPVLLLLALNGLLLGALWALYASHGLGLEFLGWVLPHGVTELLAIVLCAAAGLALGRALLFPGRTTRRHALAAAGRGAAPVVLGALVLFGLAGLLEGFFRQLVLHDIARWSVAAGSLVLWAAYLVGAGRRASR
jgi:uncharacterized membrane protein SpoIIM required for sporulation